MGRPRAETIRRQRLGDLRRLLLHRYGPVLPDDDAGREDLIELLKPISLGPNAAKRMKQEMELVAPWASAAAIDHVNRLPIWERKPKAEALGQRMRTTNAERERLRLWTIAPIDMTGEQMAEQRKAKARGRERERRRRKGAKPRADYLAQALSRTRPWEMLGISRRTYYRRRGTGPCEAKIDKRSTHLCHASRVAPPKGHHGNGGLVRHHTITNGRGGMRRRGRSPRATRTDLCQG
jgi:hypothetical protein